MDGMVAAFVVALMTQAGDRPPWLLAQLSQGQSLLMLACAAVLANVALAALAVAGAMVVAPTMNGSARSLLFGLSLIAAAIGMARPPRAPMGRHALAGMFLLGLGDRTQFAMFGSAVLGSSAILAGAGGAAGATLVSIAALVLGERAWLRLPWRMLRWIPAGMLAIAGTVSVLGALRVT